MRTAILFCLTLFFLLFKGNDSAHATHLSQARTTIQFDHSKHVNKPFHKIHHLHTQKETAPRENTYVEESQDEDDSTKIAITSIKQIATLCYQSLLVDENVYQKLALPHCEHLSYTSSFKYLLLRVFRI
ncbi:MAG: hypothetical protein EOO42_03845 [Flavobacteriales bacterium]|nr:MAG: hypothetical protein EOO42_03845 [Flavobacteriales bacterium]